MLTLRRCNLFIKKSMTSKVVLKFKNCHFLFCLTPNLLKLFKNVHIMIEQIFHKMKYDLKVIQGHIRPLLCQNYSTTFVYPSILMKICKKFSWSHNLFIKLCLTWNVTFMLWRSFVFLFSKFCLMWPGDYSTVEFYIKKYEYFF